jgi:hypothetical protein
VKNAGRSQVYSLAFRGEVWLSRGKVLKRLVEQKEEVRRFLQDSGSPLYQHFLGKKWLALVPYLSDIFDKLNRLNSSLQVPNATVFQLFDRVLAFMKNTMLWKNLCVSDTLEMLVSMSEYLEENDYAFEEIKPLVLTHLANLNTNFKNHFLELTLQQHEWMRNAFAVTIDEKISHPSIKAKESLMELSCIHLSKSSLKLCLFLNFGFTHTHTHTHKKKLGNLTTSHRGITTFWNDISV